VRAQGSSVLEGRRVLRLLLLHFLRFSPRWMRRRPMKQHHAVAYARRLMLPIRYLVLMVVSIQSHLLAPARLHGPQTRLPKLEVETIHHPSSRGWIPQWRPLRTRTKRAAAPGTSSYHTNVIKRTMQAQGAIYGRAQSAKNCLKWPQREKNVCLYFGAIRQNVSKPPLQGAASKAGRRPSGWQL
jgi:hypothetical protein